jgi:hypothetical protein
MLTQSETNRSLKSMDSVSIDFIPKNLHNGLGDVRVVPHLHHPRNHRTRLQHLLPVPPRGALNHAENLLPYPLARQILDRPNVQRGPRNPPTRRLRRLSLLESISKITVPAMALP